MRPKTWRYILCLRGPAFQPQRWHLRLSNQQASYVLRFHRLSRNLDNRTIRPSRREGALSHLHLTSLHRPFIFLFVNSGWSINRSPACHTGTARQSSTRQIRTLMSSNFKLTQAGNRQCCYSSNEPCQSHKSTLHSYSHYKYIFWRKTSYHSFPHSS